MAESSEASLAELLPDFDREFSAALGDHQPVERRNLDWIRAHRMRRMQDQLLPRAIRREIDRIYRADIAHDISTAVLHKVEEIVRQRGLMQPLEDDLGRLGGATEVVPAVHRRAILEELAKTREFIAWLRKERRDSLRSAHLTKIDPESQIMELPDHLDVQAPPQSGPWLVESDLGLGTASFLENGPEGWFGWVAQEVLREGSGEDVGIDRPLVTRVQALHAGAGAFARTLTVLAPKEQRLRVHEHDGLMVRATSLRCVAGRNSTRSRAYEVIVGAFPAPSTGGASNHRRIYVTRGEEPRADESFLGPKRWRKAVRDTLESLTPGATAYLLFPLGVRVGEGYQDAPDLIGGLLDGLPVTRMLKTIEVNSVRQPFVGTRRPKYLTVVVNGGLRP